MKKKARGGNSLDGRAPNKEPITREMVKRIQEE